MFIPDFPHTWNLMPPLSSFWGCVCVCLWGFFILTALAACFEMLPPLHAPACSHQQRSAFGVCVCVCVSEWLHTLMCGCSLITLVYRSIRFTTSAAWAESRPRNVHHRQNFNGWLHDDNNMKSWHWICLHLVLCSRPAVSLGVIKTFLVYRADLSLH